MRSDVADVRPENLQANEVSLAEIELLVLDFDGVMTDNRVLVDQHGVESVFCHRGDGWGLAQLRKIGFEVLVLSTEANPVVRTRCEKLRIGCIQDCSNKLERLKKLASERSLNASRIAYVGNDVNDLECMQWVGVPIAVADAEPEILEVSRFVTRKRGGYGAVREVCDKILSDRKHADV